MIADKAYDSKRLRAAFAARGTDLIAPHTRNQKNRAQNRRRLRRYRRRWNVERTFSWIHNNKRIWTRYDRNLSMFHGWIHLAKIPTFLKRL